MHYTLGQIVTLLLQYKYYLLFPIAVIEGPIIGVIAGFLVSLGQMNFFAAWAILIIGDAAGDAILYAIGRAGGKKMLPKYGKYLGATADRVQKLEKAFAAHGIKILLFGKWSQVFGFAVLTSAGAVRQRFGRFMLVNSLATIPKSLILVLIGVYFGKAYEHINSYLTYGAYIVFAVTIVVGAIYYFISKKANDYIRQEVGEAADAPADSKQPRP